MNFAARDYGKQSSGRRVRFVLCSPIVEEPALANHKQAFDKTPPFVFIILKLSNLILPINIIFFS